MRTCDGQHRCCRHTGAQNCANVQNHAPLRFGNVRYQPHRFAAMRSRRRSCSNQWIMRRVFASLPAALQAQVTERWGAPEADPVWGVDPNIGAEIPAEFAVVNGAEQTEKRNFNFGQLFA